MVALAVLIGVLALGAFILHRIAVEWGNAERSFWDCVLAMAMARMGSRGLKLIPGLHPPELIVLGFGVYALVLVVFLAAYAKVPTVRALAGGLGVSVFAFVGAIIATAMLVTSEAE
jgi:hypothetical protein